MSEGGLWCFRDRSIKQKDEHKSGNKERMKTMSKGAATMGRSLRWFVVACAVMGVLSAVGMSTAWGAPLPRDNESVAPWFLPLQEHVDGVTGSGLVHSTVADASAILAASPTAYLASTSKGRVDDGEDRKSVV